MSKLWFDVADADRHCAEECCGHQRYLHRRGTGRCMDGVNQPGWRCDCQEFVAPEES